MKVIWRILNAPLTLLALGLLAGGAFGRLLVFQASLVVLVLAITGASFVLGTIFGMISLAFLIYHGKLDFPRAGEFSLQVMRTYYDVKEEEIKKHDKSTSNH